LKVRLKLERNLEATSQRESYLPIREVAKTCGGKRWKVELAKGKMT
jgi:hypothetical protein